MTAEILLIEDSAADVRLVEEACRESGLAVRLTVATDGQQGLALLRDPVRPMPNLVLLDLNLPGMDGRQVLARIKADPALRGVPVVVLTTSSTPADICQAYDLHANCYITKPAQFEEFLGVVRAINDFWLATARLPDHMGRGDAMAAG